ncbi:MAG: hypothetical protein JNM38_26020 [Acidobacteria bacterium]|nr:hypothetical protein [Acidobacteriota bacterium]
MVVALPTYISVALVWSVYLALHSAMISVTATVYLRSTLGHGFRFYRLFFNVVAIATLIPVVLYSRSVRGEVFFAWSGYLAFVKWTLVVGSALLFVAGSRHYDMLQFLGVRQVWSGAQHALINTSGRIDASGVLGLIRHPYYTATILLFWSSDLDATALAINVVVTTYVVIGTLLEERKLRLEFGDSYRDYQARVSMFVPWKRLKVEVGWAR